MCQDPGTVGMPQSMIETQPLLYRSVRLCQVQIRLTPRVHIKCGEVSNPGLPTFNGDVHTSADTWIFSRGDVDSVQTSINNFHTLSGFMDSAYTNLYEKKSRNRGIS